MTGVELPSPEPVYTDAAGPPKTAGRQTSAAPPCSPAPRRPRAGDRVLRCTGYLLMAAVIFFALALPAYGVALLVRPVAALCVVVVGAVAIALHPWLVRGRAGRRWRATLTVRMPAAATLPWLAGAVLLFQGYQWIVRALSAQLTDATQMSSGYPYASEPLGWLVAPLLTALLAPVIEEIAFRGYLLTRVRRTAGTPLALVVTTLPFGLMHRPLTLLPVFLFAGLVFGCAFLAFRSIWAAVLVHLLANTLSRIPATAGLPALLQPLAHGLWPWVLTPAFAGGALLMLYGGYRARLANGRRRREALARLRPGYAQEPA